MGVCVQRIIQGWRMFNSYRKLAFNEFDNIDELELADMYNEARVKIGNEYVISDQPFGQIRGEEDDFMWRQVLVNDVIVLIAVRLRNDDWYDFCLTIFTNYAFDPDNPDVS